MHWQEQWYWQPRHAEAVGTVKRRQPIHQREVLKKLKCTLQKECLAKGMTEPYGHAVSRPPVVEVEATERAISLAKLAKASLYVAHVTAKGAMEAIRDAYADGYPIFGETCTHTT